MDFYLFMNLFILVITVYAIYTFYMLKYKHIIKPTLLMSKNINENNCNDLEGYIKYILPQLGLLIVIMILNMIIYVIHFYIRNIYPVFVTMVTVFTIELFWYGFKVSKSIKFFNKN